MSENEDNINDSKISLFNYLINYLMKNRNRDRDSRTLRLSQEIYREFDLTCRRLGLIKRGRFSNIALEGLMAYFVEQYRDHPTIIQQTLTQLFVKAEPRSQVIIDLSQRLELKLVKKDLMLVVNSLEKSSQDKTRQNFFIERLKEILPKAIRIYQKTSDRDLEQLLQKTEKWI